MRHQNISGYQTLFTHRVNAINYAKTFQHDEKRRSVAVTESLRDESPMYTVWVDSQPKYGKVIYTLANGYTQAYLPDTKEWAKLGDLNIDGHYTALDRVPDTQTPLDAFSEAMDALSVPSLADTLAMHGMGISI